jgi:hypothetical protein
MTTREAMEPESFDDEKVHAIAHSLSRPGAILEPSLQHVDRTVGLLDVYTDISRFRIQQQILLKARLPSPCLRIAEHEDSPPVPFLFYPHPETVFGFLNE